MHNILKRLDAKENVLLAPYTTLKVGGYAKYFVTLNSLADLKELCLYASLYEIKTHIISGGSNTLFPDEGFLGIVIKLGPLFNHIKEHSDGSLTVGSSFSFAKLTNICILKGWVKALGFSGTPGLIGGALRMNAGSKDGEIGDVVESISGLVDGQFITFKKNEISFGYRTNTLPNNMIITEAKLSTKEIAPVEGLIKKLEELRIKRKKTQPRKNSAGSFFKNPYPHFAAKLIEDCNLKGFRYNGAEISSLHANFIVNNGFAKACDIIHVAMIAQEAVREKFGVFLKPEIHLVKEPSPLNRAFGA